MSATRNLTIRSYWSEFVCKFYVWQFVIVRLVNFCLFIFMSLKFWYSHEGVPSMRISLFVCVAAEEKFRTVVLEDKHFHYISVLYFKENPGEEERVLSAIFFSLDTSPSWELASNQSSPLITSFLLCDIFCNLLFSSWHFSSLTPLLNTSRFCFY